MKTCLAWVALMLATLVGGSALAQQEYFVADSPAGEVFMLRDLNGDGDALDAGENLLWADGLAVVTDLRSYQSSILAVSEGTAEIIRLTDLNGDGDDANILDLTFAVDRIFRGGPASLCLEEGDANGDSDSTNILDLTFLVDRIFRGGPAPGPC